MEYTVNNEYLRMVVHHWDDVNVYGSVGDDAENMVTVCYAKGNACYDFDWSYLRKLWRRGTKLNLIHPRREGDVLFPELIILEPDYLVDVSSVASCFSIYAESPFVSLINRLTPSEKTMPILLGLMAGQLLDEELHDGGRAYSESVQAFFRNHAMSILGVALDNTFHTEAQRQSENIHRALSQQLPAAEACYDRKQVIVEPSFVCEMLGLQGRMDFLQLDMRILIEQKSGKAEFVPHDSSYRYPKAKEEHYVQMLLYMAILRYNYREQYEGNGCHLSAFLLYSKYTFALLGMDFDHSLLFRAIRLRNRMAALDLELSREGFDVLTELTAESLNMNQLSGKIWQVYIKPRLDAILLPIKDASSLERLYYLRMLRFVAKEHHISKLGTERKECSGFASLWLNSLNEKLSAGNIYCGLRLTEPTESGGKVVCIVLRFGDCEVNDTSNFRIGDIVLLYPYAKDALPDVRRTIVFRGTIADISAEELVIRLRNEQTDACVFVRDIDKYWAVEHDFMEASYSSLYSGVQSFLSAPEERRNLLMLRRCPETDETRSLKGDYGDFNELALRVKQAKDFFLIIGPPGTGKTSFGMLYTLQEELREQAAAVLVMAYTNRAVDEICGKLRGNVDFIRIGNAVSCAPEYREHLLEERMAACRNVAGLQQMISETHVFVGTVSSLNSCGSLFSRKRFSLAIIDEASQILEPHIVGLLSARHGDVAAINKFVMIGDHKQLPAVVQQSHEESVVTQPELHTIGLTDCRLSLFERLLSHYRNDPHVTYMLTRQGRMHQVISDFSSRAFYQGRLTVVPLPHQLSPSSAPRIRFIDVPAPLRSPSDKVNQAEADVIASVVRDIYDKEKEAFAPEQVGIIVPYRNQIATVRSTIERLGIPKAHGITIDTVERFQGSQRRYIVYGFTVQRPYQLDFLTESAFEEDSVTIDRKLNVAMTRAEEYLTLVGNSRLLHRNALFAKLIDSILSFS